MTNFDIIRSIAVAPLGIMIAISLSKISPKIGSARIINYSVLPLMIIVPVVIIAASVFRNSGSHLTDILLYINSTILLLLITFCLLEIYANNGFTLKEKIIASFSFLFLGFIAALVYFFGFRGKKNLQ